MRASEALVSEPAKSWQRLQQAKEFFVDLEEQMKEQHQQQQREALAWDQ